MTGRQLKQRDGAAVDTALIDAFEQDFQGEVILAGDPDYDRARQIWNASIDRHPGMIARCLGTADIIQAVNFARENNLLVAVRGGGHNVAGRALCDDGIVIDLSLMKGVRVDPQHSTVWVQAGATLGDLDRETHLYGLAVPSGVVSKTGIAGLTLGGGVGWLVRKYGLSCDNILSCEVVTADGKLVTANSETNADLFWALRGGGGNCGIVSSFLFKAYPVSTVLGGAIFFPRAEAKTVLRNYRKFIKTAPEELTAYAALVPTPDGRPAVAVAGCYCGELPSGETVFAALRKFGTPLMEMVQPMPFPAMQKIFDASFPDKSYNYWKSVYLKELGDDAIDILVDRANTSESPMSNLVVEFYGGALGRLTPDSTAFAQRGSEFNIGIAAQWTASGESEKHIGWAREVWNALQPHASGGYLPNFASDEEPDQVKANFGANYARLKALKAKFDPKNLFSLNQNVKPTGT